MDVHAHADYRALIASWLRAHADIGARRVAERVGVPVSALALIVRGRRPLDPVLAIRLAMAMRLDESDGTYLLDLVLAERGQTPEDRRAAAERAAAARASRRS